MMKNIVYYIVIYIVIGLLFSGCQLLEINIVQRSAIEEGEGISTSSVDTQWHKEEDKLEMLVPIK